MLTVQFISQYLAEINHLFYFGFSFWIFVQNISLWFWLDRKRLSYYCSVNEIRQTAEKWKTRQSFDYAVRFSNFRNNLLLTGVSVPTGSKWQGSNKVNFGRISNIKGGGSVAEWFERRICNSEAPSSSSALITSWICSQ